MLLVFFCVKAVSSPSYLRPTPRSAVTTASDMRISTYNLRYDSMPDNITVQQTLASLPNPLTVPVYLAKSGEQPWSERRIKVAQHIIHEGGVMASECMVYFYFKPRLADIRVLKVSKRDS